MHDLAAGRSKRVASHEVIGLELAAPYTLVLWNLNPLVHVPKTWRGEFERVVFVWSQSQSKDLGVGLGINSHIGHHCFAFSQLRSDRVSIFQYTDLSPGFCVKLGNGVELAQQHSISIHLPIVEEG